MKRGDRYDASGLEETEPGSRGRVLKNLLGIKTKREMDRAEAVAQYHALIGLILDFEKDHHFTAADVCEMHKTWLGSIYPWAGQYRRVNLSKSGFLFAPANQIPRLMEEFEGEPLRKYTPCNYEAFEETARAMGVVHAELMLIHPFREGNGRVGRLLAVAMGLQAGLPPLDFGGVKGAKRQQYFAAVRAGLGRNYEPMKKVFSGVIRRTLRSPWLKLV